MKIYGCAQRGVNSPAITMEVTPIHANALILPSVWILAKVNPKTAATATNTAVHAPWVERALKATEMPIMAAADAKVKTDDETG